MSRRKRRTFTTEQKAQAVRLAQELGSIAQAARDLDLTESSLSSWIKQAKIDEGGGQSGELTTDEREELQRLRRENRILEQERSFLKKAAAYFAEDTITERRSK
jgi:transposase